MTQPQLGDVWTEFRDGGLGPSRTSVRGELGILGVSSQGDEVVRSFGKASLADMVSHYGTGPLVDAIQDAFQGGAQVLRTLRIAPADVGELGTPTDVVKEGTGTIGFTGNPLDEYQIAVEILTTGATGIATYRYSLDGGDTWSDERATSATSVLGATGVEATFVGAGDDAFEAGDLTTVNAEAPEATTQELQDALEIVLASPYNPALILIAGTTGNAQWAALDTKASDFVEAYKFCHFICCARGPDVVSEETVEEWSAALLTEKSTTSEWVEVVATPLEYVALDGSQRQRSGGALYAGWLSAQDEWIPPGRVKLGALPGVLDLAPDGITETQIKDLDTSGYTTFRTYRGLGGGYVTMGRMIVGTSSDYRYVQNRRVLNLAATRVRTALLRELQGDADEAGLKYIEGLAQDELNVLVGPGKLAGAKATVPVGQDVAGTEQVEVEIRIKPTPKANWIKLDLGLTWNLPE